MKKALVESIYTAAKEYIDDSTWKELESVIWHSLEQYDVCSRDLSHIQADNHYYLNLYLASKRLEGCSEKTLSFYRRTLIKLMEALDKNVEDTNIGDLRLYLSDYQKNRNISKVTIDTIRRIISGFYSWMEDEDYIEKSPARRLHRVKTEQTIKETFTDEELELIRNSCVNARDIALIDFLASTGVRVGELVLLNRNDINLQERSCIVFGKGSKEREVYFDAKTKLHLEQYLRERQDQNQALFVSRRSPHQRITINGVEKILKRIEVKTGIKGIHPHKFRRTLATMAIDKGMPIEQVQQLLGHVRIDTTMHYAMVSQQNVKNAHRKYLG